MSEVRGSAKNGTIWTLFYGRRLRPKRAVLRGPSPTPTKIIWRINGSTGRRLSFTAHGPRGASVKPLQGPTPHAGSNWTRPGDEWGSSWRFCAAGCWVFSVRSGRVVGRVTVLYRR